MKEYSKEEKREYFKRQMESMKDTIEDKITDFLENSEELKKFIEFRKKHFYSYSINNTLLIYRQMPQATFVTGFNKWKNLGYKVKKGSKALNILIPMICKDKEDKDKVYGFKQGKVFDRSQVEPTEKAQELPNIDTSIKSTKNTKHSPERLLKATKEFVEQYCPVVESEDLGEAMGMTNGKKVYIKPTNNRVDMTGVMVHEFSHYYNHYGENRKELGKNQKESEAELTTLIFGSYFNLNIEGTYKYLSMYRKDRELIPCFEKAYKTFIDMLEGVGNKKGLESILES